MTAPRYPAAHAAARRGRARHAAVAVAAEDRSGRCPVTAVAATCARVSPLVGGHARRSSRPGRDRIRHAWAALAEVVSVAVAIAVVTVAADALGDGRPTTGRHARTAAVRAGGSAGSGRPLGGRGDGRQRSQRPPAATGRQRLAGGGGWSSAGAARASRTQPGRAPGHLAGRVTGRFAVRGRYRSATNVPYRLRTTTRPSSARMASASRATWAEVPCAAARSRFDGSFDPGASAPDLIFARTNRATCSLGFSTVP